MLLIVASVHHFRLTLRQVVLTSSPCGHTVDAIWLMFDMHLANVRLSLGQDEATGSPLRDSSPGMILHTALTFFDARMPSGAHTAGKAVMPGDDVSTIRGSRRRSCCGGCAGVVCIRTRQALGTCGMTTLPIHQHSTARAVQHNILHLVDRQALYYRSR